jgi:ketosteroid isomerase-like protein
VSATDDRLEIEAVLYRYADAVDRAALNELGELFTEDVELDYGFERVFRGRDRVLQLLHDRLGAYAGTSHHVSNPQIVVDGPRAEVSSSVYAWHQTADTAKQLHVWGRYEDRFVRGGDGRWRIASRTIRAAGEKGFPPAPGRTTAFEPIARQAAGE